MTTAIFRSGPSLAVPPTQNTAPVLEFNCLYTHDVRKKTKKWQDGFLRFHTFNRRIMVYDVSRNLIGDLHWTRDECVQEGDGLTLENKAVMVEVSDQTGQKETDLTELRKGRMKDQRVVGETPLPRTTPRSFASRAMINETNTELKHRSLNTLLGMPKRALVQTGLPHKTAYEEREVRKDNAEWEHGRQYKRPRLDTNPSWDITRTTTTIRPIQSPRTQHVMRNQKMVKSKKAMPNQQRLTTKEVIDLSSDTDSKAPLQQGRSKASFDPAPSLRGQESSEVQAKTSSTEGICFPAHRERPKPYIVEAVSRLEIASNERSIHTTVPAVQASVASGKANPSQAEDFREMDSATSCEKSLSRRPTSPHNACPAESRIGQVLRMTASAPRKRILVCQDQLRRKPKMPVLKHENEASVNLELHRKPSETPASTARKQLESQPAANKQTSITSHSGLVSHRGLNSAKSDKSAYPRERMGLHSPGTTLNPAAPKARCDRTHLPLSDLQSKSPAMGRPNTASDAEESPPCVASDLCLTRTPKTRRTPSTLVRYTSDPSPAKLHHDSTDEAFFKLMGQSAGFESGDKTASSPGNGGQRKSLQRSASLSIVADGVSSVALPRSHDVLQTSGKERRKKQLESPKCLGPWSREAFDLFTWRPPDWNEEKWCLESSLRRDSSSEHGVSNIC